MANEGEERKFPGEALALWLEEHRRRYESDHDDEYHELIQLLKED